jgi:hypothetical protein
VRVVDVVVEDAGAAGAGLGQQLVHAASSGEPPNGAAGQSELTADGVEALTLGA